MSIRNKLAIALMTFLVPMAYVGTAAAQAGDPCSAVGRRCGLGGQIRGQIGDGLPLPISIADTRTGPFVDITIQTKPATPAGLALRGLGLGQPGQVKPTVNATIMQTIMHPHTPNNPRNVTLAPARFGYGPLPEGSIGVLAFNTQVLAVQTNLILVNPHPGTDGQGGGVVVPTSPGFVNGVFKKDGRPGLSTVTFCAGALTGTVIIAGGTPNNNFGDFCALKAIADGIKLAVVGEAAGINGFVRYTKTKNQFGGVSTGRTLGTAKVYFNVGALIISTPNGGPGDLPCNGGTNPDCQIGISVVIPGTTGVAGGPFGGTVTNASFTDPTGRFTASLGFNGTILMIGNPVTLNSIPVPFTGQPAVSIGFPLTTGLITISVTDALPVTEIWKRTGTDARTAGGQGVIALNTGAMSARPTSKGNANRTWITLEIPEPSAIFAASAGLFALFGCHQWIRRRSR